MTILLGALPCIRCKAPVTVVKRTAEVPCRVENLIVMDPIHYHAIPDVALAVVDDDGSTHICPVAG